MTTSVVVWDRPEDPPVAADEVLCWQSHAHGKSISSVPLHLETHAERIRSKYLAFVHDIGESLIGGRRLLDHLDFGDGFSFWWMTTIAEKSPLKSPRIYDCLRMLALEEMLAERHASNLTLVSSDQSLAQAMRATCRNLNIGFSWQRRGSGRKWSLRDIYVALPYTLKALLSLRHVVMRWPLRKLRSPQWFTDENAVFICSYFIHLDSKRCAQGQFHSRQWEALPKLLHESGRLINWLQLFLFSAAVPRIETGLSWIRRFNSDARNQGCHAFVDSYLSSKLVLKAIRNWLRLCAVGRRLRNIPQAFRPHGSALWLWPLLCDDWRLSLYGQTGMANCLAVQQFDAALADIPHQDEGLYLWENQAWEKALIRAWRKHGHGRLIGVQHSTAPFWHLYNFDDARSLKTSGKGALPLPDQVAVNGAVIWRTLLGCGYPEDKLVQVEALRYLNLSGLAAMRAGAAGAGREALSIGDEQPRLKLLVLGDLIPTSVHHLLRMVEGAIVLLRCRCEITFKPHPGYPVELTRYPGLAADETVQPLAQILTGFDVAISANSTSAAVDAYVAGLPVIIGLDGDNLNLSPLRGQPGVRFVSSAEDLADALCATGGEGAPSSRDRDEFFFLDPELPRWKRLMTASPR